MTTITKSIVIDTLRSIVEEYGQDYVYPAAKTGDVCTYANSDGTPSCIVGHFISRIDPEGFKKVANMEASEGESFSPDAALKYAGILYDTESDYALSEAQDAQDSGQTWGDALQEAIAAAE